MRWLGILGIFAAFIIGSADAMDANSPCPGLLEKMDGADDLPTQSEQPLLTDNQCETLKNQELRLPLLQIPQEDEDPVELSLGVKNGGGILRLKIPFSF
jgi:hypothetical protein